MISQLQKAMATRPKGLTAAILVFLMLAAAITAVAASGTPQPLNASLPGNSPQPTHLHPEDGSVHHARRWDHYYSAKVAHLLVEIDNLGSEAA